MWLKQRINFLCLIGIALFGAFGVHAQINADIEYLCSAPLSGRGYVNGGLDLAASYIKTEFEKAGLQPLEKGWYQPFRMSVNTFPSAMEVKVNGRTLNPGSDYLVKASSSSIQGEFRLRHIHLDDLEYDVAFEKLKSEDLSQTIVVLDTMTFTESVIDRRYKLLQYNQLKAKGVIIKSKRNIIWTVAREQAVYFTLECIAEAVQDADSMITLDIDAKLVKRFKAKNVWGMIPGTQFKDSFLFITAHYDHLGMMGKETMFPGANDNASGTAMMLELARYYGKNPQPFTVVFVAFTAEEAGLVGSKYFTERSPVDLKKIRFLMNLDLEGTGKDGITAVNATLFEAEYVVLLEVNEQGKYLSKLVRRGKAANSDHYWFAEQGVPCFFLYQMGEYGHYHDPGDKAEGLPLDAFVPTQKLVIDFFTRLQSPN